MVPDPPPNFVDINTASTRLKSKVNIIGVVTDFQVPAPSRGTDWMCSFSLVDSSHGGIHDDGLKIRFFRPMQSEMPAITGKGDVVLLRSIGIKEWSGMTMGISNRETLWTVFPAASIPTAIQSSQIQPKHVKEPRATFPSLPEIQYVISVCNSRDRSTFSLPNDMPTSSLGGGPFSGCSPAKPTRRNKFALIKDVDLGGYYDLVAQVVKVYAHNNRVELYVSDYTSNKLLWNYEWGQDEGDASGREGDEYNYTPRNSSQSRWNGPYGKLTLTVTLWPPHASFGRDNLKENDYVFLRNAHIRWSKGSKTEGVLHTDERYPDRIDVTILKHYEDDDRVKDLLRRKRAYAKKFHDQNTAMIAEAKASKRKAMDDTAPLSKNQARKKRKQQQLKERSVNPNDMNNSDDKKNHSRALNDVAKDSHQLAKCQKQDLNPNVNCSHHLIKPRSVSSITSLDSHLNDRPNATSYTLPFQNINSRATVRVIDFFPSDLADFAVPCPKSSEFDILSDAEDSARESESASQSENISSSVDEERRWEWRFGLVIGDAIGPKYEQKATMEVYVAGQDAEYLLKIDAEDLRKSPEALATLREKLFLLWGDLEERKSRKSAALKQIDPNSRSPCQEEPLKSKPFQCCIKEYGIKKMIQRSVDEVESENDGDSEGEAGSVQQHLQKRSNWVWERKWRMFGCTII